MGLQEVKLPPDLPNWSLVKTLLQELQTRLKSQNITDQETGWYMQTIYTTIQSDQPVSASCSNPISRLVQSVYSSFHSRSPAPSPLSRLKSQIQSNVKKKLDPECVWYGMMKYMKSVSKNEREHFLYLLLPGIIHLALEIEENRPPGGLYLSRKQNSGSTAMSRQFVCSIVAGFFLCLFPERKRETSPTFNIINFTTFFQHLQLPSQVSKLRCLLHYFECIIERGLQVQGSIVVTRKSIKSEWLLDFDQLTECDVNLCPLTVLTEGNIEDSAPHAIQVDFANQSLGGGVLGKGRVQEEIKFCVCPELLSVLLFMESMDANEAVSVSGFEQFSCYRGYADSLEFAGHYNGQVSKKRLRMVAIDAMSYREFHPMKQYEETYVMRDLNKALIGFCRVTGSEDSLLVEEVETKLEIDTEVVSPSLDADEQISENVEISRECKDLSVESLAEDVHSQSSIDQSPDSTDSIDYCPLVDSGGSAAADHSQTFRSQPPAFISGIIHGNVSCLRVSPLSILSSVSHIVPQQPVSFNHSAGSCNILQPAIHSSDSQTVPVYGPGAEPSGPHEQVSDASQVHYLSEPYGTLVSKTSPASCSSQNSCGSSLNDLTAVGPTPRLSSALAKPSVLSSDTSSYPLNESGFQSLEQTAISHSHSFSESADRLHKWEFDILGNLTKVFSAKVVRVSLSEGLSSSVDGSSFTMYDLNLGPVKTLKSGQNLASANQPASLSALDEKRDESLNSLTCTYGEKGLLESSIYSDKMCSSLEVNVDSPLVETDSLGKEQNELYISVEDNDFHYNLPEDAGIVSFDSTHLEPTSSISPQSSASSANISPLSSFTLPSACYPEPLNGSHDVHMSADFFIPGLGDVQEQHHRDSKELQAELREFLSSYSSGSRSSGSGPYSSNNSTWGSRSGSISSHGTNGSSNDFIEFWNHFRRRSSQLSDNTSRRSSSSKHSSDFSTDLEEISESFQKHDHGVIEEEGGVVTLLTDCATQIVSTTMKSSVSGPECQDEACIQDLSSKTETVACAVSRTGKPRRTFTRAGTLVRQEKVTQEQEDMGSVESKVTESSSSEGPNEEKRIDSSFGGMQYTLTPPKPALYTSFISAPSSISSPLQSIDSGFISVQAMASASKESDSVPSGISTALSTELPPESIGSQSMGQSMQSTVPVGDLSQRQEKLSQDLSAVTSVQCLSEGRAPSTLPKFHPSKSTFGPDKTKSRHAVKTHDRIHSTLQLTETESQSLVEAADMKALKEKSPVKSKSSRVPEKLAKTTCPKPGKETKHSASREAAAASVSPSSTDSVSHMSSGASGPSRSSGIPKIKSSPKKSGHSDKHIILHPSHAKSKIPEKLEAASVEKERAKVQKNKRSIIKERVELSAKPLKSRYVFSDVAAPPSEKKQKHKDSPHKKSGRSSSRSLEDKRKSKQRQVEKEVHDFTKSPRFIRFVNSLAEISLSQAVLEGAEMLSLPSLGQEDISDEVYTWFANKIISEVFSHVIGEIESREFLLSQNSPSNLGEIGASGDLMSQAEGMIGDYENPPLGASSREPAAVETGTARPKTKSILPQRSDTAASSARIIASQGLQRSSGSLKMVKFKEEDPKKLTEQQATFQAPIINNIPLRRRSSLDLPLVPPPSSRVLIDLPALQAALPRAPEQRRRSLTGADLSVNIYQAAASIVNQVFQNISDSMMETQALSPGSSSCYHGTMSSSDTGAHSTGSRIHSHYDSFTSNIFSSSSTKASESPRRARRSVSPSIGVFFRKPMSRETLTSAYLKVDHSPQIKSYERRSSEPCQTSVQLSLQAFNNNKFNGRAWEEKKKISRTDDDIGRGKTWRRGSLDGFSFDQRRNSCGFKDPVLSRFAEELMKADTSVPELVIVGSHASSSSTGSRRSSVSAFRDSTLANLENELLNTSFTSGCSMSSRSQRHLDRSRSRDSRQGKSDSSDTEYWFPPPKFVGDEFQLEYNRQHSQDELQDYASFFAGQVVQEAVCVLRCDPDYLSLEQQDVDMYAENLTDQIMRDALVSSVHGGVQSENTHMAILSVVSDRDSENSHPPSYAGQGAIPKVRLAKPSSSPRVTSQPRSIPQRKSDRLTEHESYPRHNELSVHSRLKANKQQGERRASSFGSAATPHSQSQRYLHPAFKPASSSPQWPGGARPKQPPASAADRSLPSSQSKRHSSPSPLSMVSSYPSHYQSSLQVPTRVSYRRHLTLAMRSKSESHTGGAYTLSTRQPEQFSMVNSSYNRRQVSPASHSSADADSDQTCSSLVYSSDTSSASWSSMDSIGPTGPDATSDFRSPSPLTTRDKKRGRSPRGCEDYSRRRQSERVAGSNVARFSEQISCDILSHVMQHCKQDKWMRYMSYHQPIATGNWGCGAYHGNPQLKFILQWLAASIARSPLLMYYTFQDSHMTQAKDIAHIISGLTVGQLANLLQEYCSMVCLQSPASFSSPGRQWSPWQHSQNAQPSISLFDFLRQKFDRQSDNR